MGITIPAGLEIYYNKTLKMYDFSLFCNIGKNPRFMTRSRYYRLKEISYLFQIARSWSEFGSAEKQAWLDAGDIPGMNEVVEDGTTGRLLSPDPRAWAEAIGGLRRDPSRLTAWSTAARRAFIERFTLERCVDATAAVYERALSEERR